MPALASSSGPLQVWVASDSLLSATHLDPYRAVRRRSRVASLSEVGVGVGKPQRIEIGPPPCFPEPSWAKHGMFSQHFPEYLFFGSLEIHWGPSSLSDGELAV